MEINRTLVRLGFQQLLRTRKFLFALLVSLVPLLAGILLLANDLQDAGGAHYRFTLNFTDPVGFMILLGTVPFVTLMLAGGHLADEAEDRTLTYLLVRPVKRSTLYLSRYIPVAVFASALAMLQVLLFFLMRLLAFAFVGVGSRIPAETGDVTYHPVVILFQVLPAALVAAGLEAAILAAVFGLVSLITTRFHFFVNLVLVLFDVSFGSLGGSGLGALAVTFWTRSMLQGVDPTESLVGSGAPWWLVPVWLAGWTVLWLYLGMKRIRVRDFNITSAAT